MQDSYQREVVRTVDHLVFDTAMAAFTETESAAKSRTMSIASSDMDSFVSATDVSWSRTGLKQSLQLTCTTCFNVKVVENQVLPKT